MTPERVLTATVKALEQAERDVLTLIKRRLSFGQESPQWAQARLAETRDLLTEVRILLNGVVPDAATVRAVLEEAWRVGVAWSDADLTAAQRALTAGTGTALLPAATVTTATGAARTPRILLTLIEDTTRALDGLPTVILRSTADIYQQAVIDAATRQATGTVSLGEAVRDVTKTLDRRGVRGFVDRSGRQWRASTYARMALRTAYARAANDARLTRYTDRGVTLVQVSDAVNECPLCRPWENTILRVSDDVAAPAGVVTAGTVGEAQAAGLQHPNCRHLLNAFIPGLSRTPVMPDRAANVEMWPPAP